MRNYRHVLKRFVVNRNSQEADGEFIARMDKETQDELSRIGQEMLLDVDEYTSFIFEDFKIEDFETKIMYTPVKAAVIEIYELPTVHRLETIDLYEYHDEFKKEEDNNGDILDIDLEDVLELVHQQRAILLGTLGHIEQLIEKQTKENL